MSPRASERGRTCLGCRRQRPRAELVRIARGPDGGVCFDLEGKLPGRGAWVCPTPACLDALTAEALGRVFRAPVRLPAPPARREALTGALRRRTENLLTIARRMRGLAAGDTAARAALDAGRARLLLLATDASPATVRSWLAHGRALPLRRPLLAQALGERLGRGPLSVVAVTVEGLARALCAAIDRWQAIGGISCDNRILQSDIEHAQGGAGAVAGGG